MARYGATINSSLGVHSVHLQLGDLTRKIDIPVKESGFGSSVTGGELLFLAMATCYCNDLYREAAKRGIRVEGVEVQVEGDFEREGAPATNVSYSARVKADASREAILELMRHTDTVAEIQNTMRVLTPVALESCEMIE